jgi:outer membrane protein OmpA-like peptidoglycan-associated protein
MRNQLVSTAIVLAAIAGLPGFTQGTKSLYTVETQSASTKAVDYAGMGGSAKIGFRGTALATKASGKAKVSSQGGVMAVDARFANLEPASKYGPETMTYVLWAISPEGRISNLGEVLTKGGKGSLRVTTRLQAFALIVTAEPYFAVSQVGNTVVLENVLDDRDAQHLIAVNYDHLPQGQYAINVDPADLEPVTMDKKTPPDFYQARNAVTLARAAGADQFAADSFRKAADLLTQAENALKDKKGDKKSVAPLSRHAVQQAEDSRQLAIRKQAEEQVAAERRALEEKAAAQMRALETAVTAEKRALEERATAEKQAMEERVAAAQKETAEEASRRVAAQKDAEQARLAVAQSEREQAELRAQLRDQLNAVMKTTDSARGLIVSMTGLLFESGRFTLLQSVRENLARVGGILVSHPGLVIEVEGHTDSDGSEGMNQTLSENRAGAVRDYLLSQGVPEASIVSRGFGEAHPVATNDTAEGKSQNRRVEIVVSGTPIGAETAGH